VTQAIRRATMPPVFRCRHAPLALPAEVVDELAARYREPHRAYHTVDHVTEVLRWFDWVAERAGWDRPSDVYLAIVFHDAIYDPLARDNEVRSAALARARVAASEYTQDLIVLTSGHGAPTANLDRDAAHFLDCDLAILGAPPAVFDAYDAAIALEYRAMDPVAFLTGRRSFLAGMLAQPRLFHSPLFHAELDAAARANLSRACARQ